MPIRLITLKYYIGYLEFLELKKDAVDKWEDNFSQMQFHKAVLDVGPASFDVIQKYVFNRYEDSLYRNPLYSLTVIIYKLLYDHYILI